MIHRNMGAAQDAPAVTKGPVSKPIFRGWYVVATLFLAGFALYGAGLYSFILFVTPLSAEFHWSRAATGGLVSAFWLTAPLALAAEPLIRRFGSRRLAAAGVIVEAASLCMLFTASHLWEMYLLRALAGLGKMLYAINLPVIISKWFSRRFGLAVAIMYSGWALGGLVLAPVTEHLITTVGWRAASVALGLGILVVALPSTLWVLRIASAQELGLGLDGDPLETPEVIGPQHQTPVPTTAIKYRAAVGQLLQHRAFQLIMAGTMAYYLTYSGVLAHQAAVVQGEDISAKTASLVLGATAGFAALGALAIGWLIDRFPFPLVITVQFTLMILGVSCLLASTRSPSVATLAAHAGCFGLAVGGSEPFWITLIRRRVPFHLFQQAWGVAYFLELAFIVIAPFMAGLLYDVFGNYERALRLELTLIIVPLCTALIVWLQPSRGRA